jgi:hypothetical protein
MNAAEDILRGAYDLHVHCAPDVVPRSDDLASLAGAACAAGMAGIVLKNHNTSTLGEATALNVLTEGPTHFYAALALNPAVGGINPAAVRAALRAGVRFIFMPTLSSAHQVAVGMRPSEDGAAEIDPADKTSLSVLDAAGELSPNTRRVCELVAEYDGVLATGHLSPRESLVLLATARDVGVKRTVVTHASQTVPGMSVEEQHRCAELGAFIEHSFLA